MCTCYFFMFVIHRLHSLFCLFLVVVLFVFTCILRFLWCYFSCFLYSVPLLPICYLSLFFIIAIFIIYTSFYRVIPSFSSSFSSPLSILYLFLSYLLLLHPTFIQNSSLSRNSRLFQKMSCLSLILRFRPCF